MKRITIPMLVLTGVSMLEQYSADFAKINDARAALVKEYSDDYGTQTDEQADSLVRRWLDVDIAAAQLRQKYVPIFRKALPGKKAATFSAGPPHQHDDRRSIDFATPADAEPGLAFSAEVNT